MFCCGDSACNLLDMEMTEKEMMHLVRQAFAVMHATGQENGNITIEVRRGKAVHVRFDLELKASGVSGQGSGVSGQWSAGER